MRYEKDGTISFRTKADMAINLIEGLKLQSPNGKMVEFNDEEIDPFRYGDFALVGAWNDLTGWIEYTEHSEFKKDEKVIVRYDDNYNNYIYYKRYFAEVRKGLPYCYADGMTSFSSDSIEGNEYLSVPFLVEVNFCVKATPENIKKYINEKE